MTRGLRTRTPKHVRGLLPPRAVAAGNVSPGGSRNDDGQRERRLAPEPFERRLGVRRLDGRSPRPRHHEPPARVLVLGDARRSRGAIYIRAPLIRAPPPKRPRLDAFEEPPLLERVCGAPRALRDGAERPRVAARANDRRERREGRRERASRARHANERRVEETFVRFPERRRRRGGRRRARGRAARGGSIPTSDTRRRPATREEEFLLRRVLPTATRPLLGTRTRAPPRALRRRRRCVWASSPRTGAPAARTASPSAASAPRSIASRFASAAARCLGAAPKQTIEHRAVLRTLRLRTRLSSPVRVFFFFGGGDALITPPGVRAREPAPERAERGVLQPTRDAPVEDFFHGRVLLRATFGR